MPKSDIVTEDGFVTEDNVIVISGLNLTRANTLMAKLDEMYPAEKKGYWDGQDYILTYPHGLDFMTYCYVVNYLVYPFDMDENNMLTVTAWCTTAGIKWGASNEIMLYVPKGDTEYDNVYITTKDGLHFKQMFAIPCPCVMVEDLTMPYRERS